MFANVSPIEIIVIIAVLVGLFGKKKTKEVARDMGGVGKELKKVRKEYEEALKELQEAEREIVEGSSSKSETDMPEEVKEEQKSKGGEEVA